MYVEQKRLLQIKLCVAPLLIPTLLVVRNCAKYGTIFATCRARRRWRLGGRGCTPRVVCSIRLVWLPVPIYRKTTLRRALPAFVCRPRVLFLRSRGYCADDRHDQVRQERGGSRWRQHVSCSSLARAGRRTHVCVCDFISCAS